ncbi:MAG: Flp family type IVb pilin [Armatimonadota bacterium]
MRSAFEALSYLWSDDAGVTSTEYALMLAVLSLATVVAFASLSTEVQDVAATTSDSMRETSGLGCSTN